MLGKNTAPEQRYDPSLAENSNFRFAKNLGSNPETKPDRMGTRLVRHNRQC